MPDFRLGDFAYLRRLSDILMPRSRKVLPAKVADQDWLPVIPYNTDLDISRFFLISAQNNSQQFIKAPNHYNLRIGSGQLPVDYILPAGWMYELIGIDIHIFTGALPAAGDLIRFEFNINCFNVTFENQSGGAPIKVTYSEHVFSSRHENTPPFLLFNNATIYRMNFPSGVYKAKGDQVVSYNISRQVQLGVPTGSEDGWDLVINLFQTDSAGADKPWHASASIETEVIFKRRPIGNYEVLGIRNI